MPARWLSSRVSSNCVSGFLFSSVFILLLLHALTLTLCRSGRGEKSFAPSRGRKEEGVCSLSSNRSVRSLLSTRIRIAPQSRRVLSRGPSAVENAKHRRHENERCERGAQQT